MHPRPRLPEEDWVPGVGAPLLPAPDSLPPTLSRDTHTQWSVCQEMGKLFSSTEMVFTQQMLNQNIKSYILNRDTLIGQRYLS